jgi:hypothetical protein
MLLHIAVLTVIAVLLVIRIDRAQRAGTTSESVRL